MTFDPTRKEGPRSAANCSKRFVVHIANLFDSWIGRPRDSGYSPERDRAGFAEERRIRPGGGWRKSWRKAAASRGLNSEWSAPKDGPVGTQSAVAAGARDK